MSITEKIVVAITGMHKIILYYFDTREKIVKEYKYLNPYLLGIHAKTENVIMSAYFEPEDNGLTAGWKTFLIDNIQSIKVTDEKHDGNNAGYNSNDSRMKTILCNIPE